MPEQEPEEAAAMSEVITEHEQVLHHDSDVNEEEEKVTATFEVITEYEQVPQYNPDVNTEEDVTFEIVTESSYTEQYAWNGNTIKDNAKHLLTTDSAPDQETYGVVTEFEIQPIIIPPKSPEPEGTNVSPQRCNNNKPIATNAIVPFKRTISETLGSKVTRPQGMDICKTVVDKSLKRRKIGNILLKIPLKSACFKRKPAKILLLKSKIPKIPIKRGSFRVNYPKTVPKPLKLSYKRLKIPSDTNSLYSSFHQRKGILRTECVIEKQLHQFCPNELRCISKEAKNRMPVLC